MSSYEQKIFTFVEGRLLTKTKTSELSILRDEHGVYLVYGRYVISPKNNEFDVSIKNMNTTHVFPSLKMAFAWCFFHHKNKLFEANDLQKSCMKLISVISHIEVETAIMRKTQKQDDYILAFSKLSELQFQKLILDDKINKYVKQSKAWQDSAFKNR